MKAKEWLALLLSPDLREVADRVRRAESALVDCDPPDVLAAVIELGAARSLLSGGRP